MPKLTNESLRQIDASRLGHPASGQTNRIGSSKTLMTCFIQINGKMFSKGTEQSSWTNMLAFHDKIINKQFESLETCRVGNQWSDVRDFKTENELGNLSLVNMNFASGVIWGGKYFN